MLSLYFNTLWYVLILTNRSVSDERGTERGCRFACPVAATVSLIGGKWKPIIIWRLRGRKVRFNRLMAEMPDISPKMLTKQLRELERDGLGGEDRVPPRYRPGWSTS